jgi:hypothetical protein
MCCHRSRKTIKTIRRAVERGKRHLSFFNLISGLDACIAFKRLRNFVACCRHCHIALRYNNALLRKVET